MKSPQLADGQPDKIRVDRGIEFFSQAAGSLGGGRLTIAAFPNERRGVIETMCLVALHVVNQRLVVQFTDDQVLSSGSGKSGSDFHFRIPPCRSLKWFLRLFLIISRGFKSIARRVS